MSTPEDDIKPESTPPEEPKSELGVFGDLHETAASDPLRFVVRHSILYAAVQMYEAANTHPVAIAQALARGFNHLTIILGQHARQSPIDMAARVGIPPETLIETTEAVLSCFAALRADFARAEADPELADKPSQEVQKQVDAALRAMGNLPNVMADEAAKRSEGGAPKN